MGWTGSLNFLEQFEISLVPSVNKLLMKQCRRWHWISFHGKRLTRWYISTAREHSRRRKLPGNSQSRSRKSRRVRSRQAIAHAQLTKPLSQSSFQTKRNRNINLIQEQKLFYSLLHVLYPIRKWISCRHLEFLSKRKIGRGINCY